MAQRAELNTGERVGWRADERMAALRGAEDQRGDSDGGDGLVLRPGVREDSLAQREEVATVVRELMEGEKGRAVRLRSREVQEAAARALSPEGSSRRALLEVANKWKAALVKEK